MSRALVLRVGRLGAVLLVLAVFLVGAAGVAADGTTVSSATVSSSTSGVLLPSDRAIYTFSYDGGGGSDLQITMTYNPANPVTDETVTLEVYSPQDQYTKAVFGKNTDCGLSSNQLNGNCVTPYGIKQVKLGSPAPGSYVAVVHNWNPTGYTSPANYNVSTKVLSTGADGPALTLLAAR